MLTAYDQASGRVRMGMDLLTAAHLAGGGVALLSGAVAAAARKGSPVHVTAGRWFVGAMLSLWPTATILNLLEGEPGSAAGNIFIAYFVLTAWAAARRRDGTTGAIEIVACALAFATAALIVWGLYAGLAPPTPVGLGPVFVLAGVCVLAGALDLNAILRARLTDAQRISRHLWRMCAAFFIATGSFFIGQQDALPQAVRGSPVLLALGFAPLALMVFWLARVRFGRTLQPGVGAAMPQG